MNHPFWLSRWVQNDIGFHKQQTHFALLRHFDRMQVSAGDTVLVPLCGKSLDMLWLSERGVQVLGTELSPVAVESFFTENGLNATMQSSTSFRHYSTPCLEILCGDHFMLQKSDLQGVRAVYDRAALVALPPDLRRRYADHLIRVLPPSARILLVSYEYDQDEIAGPPFAVPLSEISTLFSPDFEIELLDIKDALSGHQGLRSRGVTKLNEFTCLLTRCRD